MVSLENFIVTKSAIVIMPAEYAGINMLLTGKLVDADVDGQSFSGARQFSL